MGEDVEPTGDWPEDASVRFQHNLKLLRRHLEFLMNANNGHTPFTVDLVKKAVYGCKDSLVWLIGYTEDEEKYEQVDSLIALERVFEGLSYTILNIDEIHNVLQGCVSKLKGLYPAINWNIQVPEKKKSEAALHSNMKLGKASAGEGSNSDIGKNLDQVKIADKFLRDLMDATKDGTGHLKTIELLKKENARLRGAISELVE